MFQDGLYDIIQTRGKKKGSPGEVFLRQLLPDNVTESVIEQVNTLLAKMSKNSVVQTFKAVQTDLKITEVFNNYYNNTLGLEPELRNNTNYRDEILSTLVSKLIHVTVGSICKCFNDKYANIVRKRQTKMTLREDLKGTGSTNKGFISGASSTKFDPLKNLMIFREEEELEEEETKEQEIYKGEEKEEANEQVIYDGEHDDGVFNDDLVENMQYTELEELEENEFDDDNTKDNEEGKHKECLVNLLK